MSKVLGIACSPRRSSNSSYLLTKFMQGVRERGLETEEVNLSDLKFQCCQACEACSLTGECVLTDDLSRLFDRVDGIDGLVIAAPVYAMAINTLGKAMVERVQVFWARHYRLALPLPAESKPGFFISTAGTTLPQVFECAVKPVRYFYHVLGMKWSGELLVNPVDKPGEILQHLDWLERAQLRGFEFADKISQRG